MMSGQPQQCVSSTVHLDVLIVTIAIEQIRDPQTAYALRDEIISLLDSSKAKNLVLDTAKLTFIGSIGFLAFLALRRHLPNGRIVFINMSEQIKKMFAVSRLIPVEANASAPFDVEPTLEAALVR